MKSTNDAPTPPALFSIVQEALLPCGGDGSVFCQILKYFDTPTIIATLLGPADSMLWDQVVSYMDAFTLGALEMTCRHALEGGWTPDCRWGDIVGKMCLLTIPPNLGGWIRAFPVVNAMEIWGDPPGVTSMLTYKSFQNTMSKVGRTHLDTTVDAGTDTARTTAIRCALLHEWCRSETNTRKICLCPIVTGGPKCSWVKELTRSEEKDQIYRLRIYLARNRIEHEPYVQQLL